VGRRLADEQEMTPNSLHSFADRLAREEIIPEIDWVEVSVTWAVSCKPPSCGAAFAVLFLVAVLWGNELGW